MGAKVQVIFYSMYGHVYKMAEEVTAGSVRQAPTRSSTRYSSWFRMRFWNAWAPRPRGGPLPTSRWRNQSR